MRKSIYLGGLALVLLSTAAYADDVTCESVGNSRQECEMNTRGEVRMVRQLSHTTCTEGVNWGLNKHTVWVEGGCRAVFRNVSQQASSGSGRGMGGAGMGSASSTGDTVCESVGNARKECEMNTRGEVRMVHQLSHTACTEGVTWGLSKHTVWVEGGCRAAFRNMSQHAAYSSGNASGSGMPGFNATCPGGLDIHADADGAVYFNGTEGRSKKVNDDYYEASHGGTTLSISKNPGGRVSVMYLARGGASGDCQVH